MSNRGGDLRNYALVTGAYWADTIADGASRMLVLFYFYERGYSPFKVAMLFLFYEVFGIITNLVGGWLAARSRKLREWGESFPLVERKRFVRSASSSDECLVCGDCMMSIEGRPRLRSWL